MGSFIGNPSELRIFFLVCISATLGLLLSQLTSLKLLNFLKFLNYFRLDFKRNSLRKNRWLVLITLSLLAIIMSYVNIKKNIMLFGLLPSVDLPLKGNVVFFLMLTRGLLFLFFFFLMTECRFIWIIQGATLCLISSTGVLSRMILVIYFSVVFCDLPSLILDVLPNIYL